MKSFLLFILLLIHTYSLRLHQDSDEEQPPVLEIKKPPTELELQKSKLFQDKLSKSRLKNVAPMEKDQRITRKFEPKQGQDVFLQWMSFISKETQEKSAELQKLALRLD